MEAADVACGLSLGEYTALAFAGAFRLAHLGVEMLQTHIIFRASLPCR